MDVCLVSGKLKFWVFLSLYLPFALFCLLVLFEAASPHVKLITKTYGWLSHHKEILLYLLISEKFLTWFQMASVYMPTWHRDKIKVRRWWRTWVKIFNVIGQKQTIKSARTVVNWNKKRKKKCYMSFFSSSSERNGSLLFYSHYCIALVTHTHIQTHSCTSTHIYNVYALKYYTQTYSTIHSHSNSVEREVTVWQSQSNSCRWPHMTLEVVMVASVLFLLQRHTVPLLSIIIYLWNLYFTSSWCVWKCVCVFESFFFVFSHDCK